MRSVIGNDHAVEVVAVKDRENANHVHIAFVDKSFAIVRHLAHDIAEMNVGNLALFAVLIYCVVNIAFGHLGQSSDAKLEGIAAAWSQINQTFDTCAAGRQGAAAVAWSAWEDRRDGRRAAPPTARPQE